MQVSNKNLIWHAFYKEYKECSDSFWDSIWKHGFEHGLLDGLEDFLLVDLDIFLVDRFCNTILDDLIG